MLESFSYSHSDVTFLDGHGNLDVDDFNIHLGYTNRYTVVIHPNKKRLSLPLSDPVQDTDSGHQFFLSIQWIQTALVMVLQ